eukprot:g10190.t1
MTSIEVVRIYKLENLILSTSDLDFLCHFKKLRSINLRHIPMNLQYIPTSCETIEQFVVSSKDHPFATLNYSWPLFWSTQDTIKLIDISIAAIDISNIPKPKNTSRIRTLVFDTREHSNSLINPRIPQAFPLFFFDGSLSKLINFICLDCYTLPTKFPSVTNHSQLRHLTFEYEPSASNNSHFGPIDQLIVQGKKLRILEITAGDMTGNINFSLEFLNQLLCLNLLDSKLLEPLNTTSLFNIPGELWLPKKVANLDKLLENVLDKNKTTLEIEWDGRKSNQTRWRVNNMGCMNIDEGLRVYCYALDKEDYYKPLEEVIINYKLWCGMDYDRSDLNFGMLGETE